MSSVKQNFAEGCLFSSPFISPNLQDVRGEPAIRTNSRLRSMRVLLTPRFSAEHLGSADPHNRFNGLGSRNRETVKLKDATGKLAARQGAGRIDTGLINSALQR